MLHLMTALLAQTSPTIEASPGNLRKELFYASSAASGRSLCEGDRAARYAKRFRARYGERIRALVSYHESRFGSDPDFIFLPTCRSSKSSNNQQDRAHSRVLDQFDKTLEELERKYGPQDLRLTTDG